MNASLLQAQAPESIGLAISPALTATVMIVDDDPVTTELVQGQLSTLGFQNLLVSTDPRQTFDFLTDHRPDLLLLDIVMPGIDGLEILARLRATGQWTHLPVIILTAVDDLDTRIRALELGATDFLNKPVNFVELACRIRNALLAGTYQAALKHQAEELQRQVALQTASLKESYAALERANVLLQQSCDAAQASTRAKNRFLANVSHEIRTPLTAIIGFTEELLDNAEFPPAAAEMLQTIRRNGEHLLEIVNDVLDMAKIEKGSISIDRVPCSPMATLADVVRWIEPRAAAKGLELLVERDGPVPEIISTDPVRLKQILANLLGNAVKFTRQGSVRVVVRLLEPACGASRNEASPSPLLEFEVIDTGVGIESDQFEEIFKPFSQGRSSAAADSGGTGLGLTISKHLAEELGGRIQVESRPGMGSTFRVTIATGPLDRVQPAADPFVGPHVPPAETEPPYNLSGCRVLLAEDSADNQRLIRLILEKAGASVIVAGDGEAAYTIALEHWRRGEAFDVVLTDIQMPRLTGYELAGKLRAQGYTGRILALTANAMTGEREKCVAAGCDDYLSKPINRRALLAALCRA